MTLLSAKWHLSGFGELHLLEATSTNIIPYAAELAIFYNNEHNRRMMGNEETSTPETVLDFYRSGLQNGQKMFLLFLNGILLGDADFRNFFQSGAEFAIMIGSNAAQGKGIGTRCAVMAHHLAFGRMGLEKVCVTILSHNSASLRMFEKIGYRPDASAYALSLIETPNEAVLSIERENFLHGHKSQLSEIFLTPEVQIRN